MDVSRLRVNPLNAELNPICHLLALLGGATIVVVSRLRVKQATRFSFNTLPTITGVITGLYSTFSVRYN